MVEKLAAVEMPTGIDAHETGLANQAIAEAFVTGFRWIILI